MARHVVQSPVAGTVWKIEAAVGAAVAERDTILILESMKMEVPVPVPAGGTVEKILVEEGDVVGERQELAVIRA